MMIKINEEFSIERDQYCWHLMQRYIGKDKHGDNKIQTRVTYHPNMGMLFRAMLEKQAGECETIDQLIDLLANCKLKEEMEHVSSRL